MIESSKPDVNSETPNEKSSDLAKPELLNPSLGKVYEQRRKEKLVGVHGPAGFGLSIFEGSMTCL